ncbi:stage VI sporulation protein D [Halalkalibacterium ligniniphilum]|uniref:stage VI sporulation protein D n=1 Tax=Halalkalibacterium ligniniphilum TaxID=1134413 RepID=UPI000349BF63|nr:stage VI sporulation protein D [Halalkalibacterium ligniniphilum]
MTQEHPSKLTFSIEESVWLNKGQEIKEILSMSLEPDISIEEKGTHVFIKGGLRLVGEYLPVKHGEAFDANAPFLQEQVSFRSVEEMSIGDDGTGEIKHVFPIDVTIPLSRIQNLEDVFVEVESFDYDLPEKSCIQLTADVAISGMTGVEEEPKANAEPTKSREGQEQQLPPVLPIAPALEPIPSTFQFEARKEKKEWQEYKEKTVKKIDPEDVPTQEEGEQNSKKDRSIQEGRERNEASLWAAFPNEYKEKTVELNVLEQKQALKPKTDEHSEMFASTLEEEKQDSDSHKELDEQVAEPAMRAEEEKEPEPSVITLDGKVERDGEQGAVVHLTSHQQREREDPVVQKQEEDIQKNKEDGLPTPREENALYLTKMLTKGEEQFSKLKMCIIQQNESLDTIAERYEVSTSQLIRVNRLNEARVEEGQILYIPVSSNS